MFDFQFECDNTITLIDRPPVISRELQPVWAGELDLLGVDRFFSYPKQSKRPLLWKVANRYFYNGLNVFNVKYKDLDSLPDIELKETLFGRVFEEIDIKKLKDQNERILQKLSEQTFSGIKRTIEDIPKEMENFILLFSGGKDSVVTYDFFKKAFVSGIFGGKKCFVYFSNTGMEFDETVSCFEYYKTKDSNIGFEFLTEKPEIDPITAWEKIGYPTRLCRWCCRVCKSSLQMKIFKKIPGEDLLFSGVRAAESVRRASYSPLEKGEMEKLVFSPLLSWSSFEIWLYILSENLFYNPLYEKGLSRVGCVLCPMGFGGKSYKDQKMGGEKYKKFREIIERSVGREKFKSGGWVGVSCGDSLHDGDLRLLCGKKAAVFLKDLDENNLDWLKIPFLKPRVLYSFENADQRKREIGYIVKAAYCVGCGVCASLCKFDAISFVSKEDGTKVVKIDDEKCKHCFACRTPDGKSFCFSRWRRNFSVKDTKERLKNEGRTDLLSLFEKAEL